MDAEGFRFGVSDFPGLFEDPGGFTGLGDGVEGPWKDASRLMLALGGGW